MFVLTRNSPDDPSHRSIGVLFHEILVERLDLGHVVFHAWAKCGDSQVIRPFLLTEPGSGDCTDSSRVCEENIEGEGNEQPCSEERPNTCPLSSAETHLAYPKRT
jgi:hypothetical protein